MKTAYINANIYENEATAFIVEDNHFAAIGNNEEMQLQLGKEDETIDLKGKFVCPGFIDSHMHLVGFGLYLTHLQLQDCTSFEQIQKMMEQRLAFNKYPWIIGRGFNEDNFEVKEYPTKQQLDAISKDVPICLTRTCGHIMICNSKALSLAGIDENTTQQDGKINFAKGIVEENAINLVHDAWPKETLNSVKDYILLACHELNKYGITSVGSDDFITLSSDYNLVLEAYEQLSFQQKLTVRVNEQCQFACLEDFQEFLHQGYTSDVGNQYFKIGPLKLIADGSLGARTACLSRPYEDDDNNQGYMLLSVKQLEAYIKLASFYNMSSVVHVIGDASLEAILNIYDDVVLENNPLHHGLVHVQITRPEQLQRIIDKKLNCYIQSIFIDYDSLIVNKRVGDELASSSYAFKTLYEKTNVTNGSDCPVELPDVLKGIQCAITRTSISHGTSLNLNEGLNVKQAIDSYTINGARAFFEDDIKGKIEEGYLADFVVLDQDITMIDPELISKAKVVMSVMDGKCVFE